MPASGSVPTTSRPASRSSSTQLAAAAPELEDRGRVGAEQVAVDALQRADPLGVAAEGVLEGDVGAVGRDLRQRPVEADDAPGDGDVAHADRVAVLEGERAAGGREAGELVQALGQV